MRKGPKILVVFIWTVEAAKQWTEPPELSHGLPVQAVGHALAQKHGKIRIYA